MKIFFDTVGCRLNQAEIEQMAGQFLSAGHEILENAEGADVVIINSCAVTSAAAADSRQKVRQAKNAGAGRILLTGCWATLEGKKAGSLSRGVEVYSNLEKMDLPFRVMEAEGVPLQIKPIGRKSLPGLHQRTRAFIKVQDGCDNRCTFCVTRLARGNSNSLTKEQVLNSVDQAERGGVKEIVLTGVSLGSWGRDKGEGEGIADLLDFLLQRSSVERIRLSSIEPWDLDDRFFGMWQDSRLCRHLHFPLQSGSAPVLHRMLRQTTPEAFRALVTLARTSIPGVAVTTDIIVGFPGETEEEYQESLGYVQEIAFSGGHVFRYSPREGTAAARLPQRVRGEVMRERAKKMRVAIKTSEAAFIKSQIDKPLQVLWEASGVPGVENWTLHGLSDNYIKVESNALQNRWNQVDRVRIEKMAGDSLSGQILYES
ncbi:MAG: MiaB/RimO family radical SAM methylthiotransferase [Chloroflexi bacterium]|nr:MiaB/RimO family radical SAM methylthiotransferase [Chloroflexota bacterium]